MAPASSRWTTEYVPFLHFDTHADGHATLARLHSEIDRPIAQLVLDLEERDCSTAPRHHRLRIQPRRPHRGQAGSNAKDQAAHKGDTLEEAKHYGLHRHFTGGTSVAMFGGGVKKGFVYGKTADERSRSSQSRIPSQWRIFTPPS